MPIKPNGRDQNVGSGARLERWTFALLLAYLLYARLFHVQGPIDDPHSWRQADTANFARELYRHGLNPWLPRVCWQGSSSIAALEFPLYEWIVALLYLPFGEHLLIARILSILCFCVACAYLHLIMRRIGGDRWARASVLLYAAAPLAIYYSRAVHVDFFVTALSHAMLYHTLMAMDRVRNGFRVPLGHVVASSAIGVLALASKAPYPAVLYAPIALELLRLGRNGLRLLPWLCLPWIGFAVWEHHATLLNQAAPDLSFNPSWQRLVHMEWWYFGKLEQRLVPNNWLVLGSRVVFECLNPIGTALFIAGAVMLAVTRKLPRLIAAWLVGTFVYVLVFWNLNGQHDYYQIPWLAPLAVVSAWPIAWLMGRGRWKLLAFGVAVALVLYSTTYARVEYFKPDPFRTGIAEVVAKATIPKDIVVVSMPGTQGWDPRILYRADRQGYMINSYYLTRDRVERFTDHGATVLVAASPSEDEVQADVFQGLEPTTYTVTSEGIFLARVRVARLARTN